MVGRAWDPFLVLLGVSIKNSTRLRHDNETKNAYYDLQNTLL